MLVICSYRSNDLLSERFDLWLQGLNPKTAKLYGSYLSRLFTLAKITPDEALENTKKDIQAYFDLTDLAGKFNPPGKDLDGGLGVVSHSPTSTTLMRASPFRYGRDCTLVNDSVTVMSTSGKPMKFKLNNSSDLAESRKAWLNFGGDYLATAKMAYNASGAAAPIVHLSQQAVENDLKALTVGHSVPITHDLGQVVDHLRFSNVLNESEINQLSSDVAIASGASPYTAARYPGNNPSYWSSLPREKISEVVFAAERIHDFTEHKIATFHSSGIQWPEPQKISRKYEHSEG